jgi:hypothetical protein
VNQLASQVVRVLPHTASALSSLHPFEIGDRLNQSKAAEFLRLQTLNTELANRVLAVPTKRGGKSLQRRSNA